MTDALLIRLSPLPRAWRRLVRPYRRHVAEGVIARELASAERLLARLGRSGAWEGHGAGLHVTGAAVTRSDVFVAALRDPATDRAVAYLKVPLTAEAEQSLVRHRDAVARVHELAGLARLQMLVPRTLATGRENGQAYHLETALAGRPAGEIVGEFTAWSRFARSAANAVLPLYLATARREVVDAASYDRLVGEDIATLGVQAAGWPRSTHFLERLRQLDDTLRERLVGRTLPLTWIHGDFWTGNLLAGDDGAVTGILDWDRARPDQLPLHDVFHLLAYHRKLARSTQAGEETLDYLLAQAFEPHERRVVDEAADALGLPADAGFLRVMAIVYWLRFAAVNLSRYPAFRNDGRWLQQNVFLVLDEARL